MHSHQMNIILTLAALWLLLKFVTFVIDCGLGLFGLLPQRKRAATRRQNPELNGYGDV